MAKITILCDECKCNFNIKIKHINQKRKEGQLNFWCSDNCRINFKRKQRQETIHCPKCNKLFVRNKFGKKSNKFCSQTCASSRLHSIESKEKCSKTIREKYANSSIKKILEKDKLVSHKCKKCKDIFLKKKYSTKEYCSWKCRKNAYINGSWGGCRVNSGIGKSGWYKGYYCGSTYELAFLIFNLDKNKSISRYNGYFVYDNNKKYYPDFIMDDIIYEIKGYHTDIVDLKAKAVIDTGHKYMLLYKKEIEPMIQYVKDTYKIKDLSVLYDNHV